MIEPGQSAYNDGCAYATVFCRYSAKFSYLAVDVSLDILDGRTAVCASLFRTGLFAPVYAADTHAALSLVLTKSIMPPSTATSADVTFGNLLKQLRRRASMTQADLGVI